MKNKSFSIKTAAIFLSGALFLASPAAALRELQPAQSGLEEQLARHFLGAEGSLSGAEEVIPFDGNTAKRFAGQISAYAAQAASHTKGRRLLGGLLSVPEGPPLFHAYRAQLKLLQLLGLTRRVLCPAIGVDYLPAEVSEQVLGIDTSDKEWLFAAMQMVQQSVRDFGQDSSGNLETMRSRLVLTDSFNSIEQFTSKAHAEGEPVTAVLKGFDWIGGEKVFLDQIDPSLKPGDFVVLFGTSCDLAPVLKARGYIDYCGQKAFPTEIKEALEEANGQLLQVGYPPEPFGTVSGMMLHLAEPWIILRQRPIMHPFVRDLSGSLGVPQAIDKSGKERFPDLFSGLEEAV